MGVAWDNWAWQVFKKIRTALGCFLLFSRYFERRPTDERSRRGSAVLRARSGETCLLAEFDHCFEDVQVFFKRPENEKHVVDLRSDEEDALRGRTVPAKEPFDKQYRCGAPLGKGGFGSVFAAERISDGLQVAVKQILRDSVQQWARLPGHPSLVPMEIALLVQLGSGPGAGPSHRGIIRMLDWFEVPARGAVEEPVGDIPFQRDRDIVRVNLSFTKSVSEECRSLIGWCLAHHPKDRPTLEQILLHPWMTEGAEDTGDLKVAPGL
ncbi:serine/threonine-protein kinase pim-2-like [Colossoma macropomum]|uniref:serine/threonine-protein kinase pim-2-like n=1 Tax=Colossoma macropomum TaxID=42526 RepID=UPI001863C927|nr:serine/threonine-protein kinase pim-2-like [Colossoma macropomum]